MSYKIHMAGRDDPRTLLQIDRLYKWQHGKEFSPATVEISPTNACNQKCSYCYAWRESTARHALCDDILVNSLDQLADAGVGGVIFQGTGEPLLHKALPSAIRRGAERSLPMQLSTNGVLLSGKLQDEILQHLFYLRISVVDSDPALYAEQHGCPENQWQTLVANLERTMAIRAQRGFSFGCSATVYLSDNNLGSLYESVKLCKELGIDFVYVTEALHTSYSPSGKKDQSSKLLPIEQIEQETGKILSLIDENFFVKIKFQATDEILAGRNKESWVDNYCQGIKFYTLIDCDGEVYPCWRCWGDKKYSFGSLYEKSFTDIWQGEKRKEIEKLIMATPPDGDQCSVCTICLLNNMLSKVTNSTKWVNFL